jgi:flagellar basal body rod protein FlgC
MKTWSDVALGNMVNIDTAWDGTGKKPYQRKTFSINKNGNASVLIDEKTLPIKRYLPVHSYADAEGFVLFPNVNLVLEIIQLENASREYGLAERLLERCMPGNYIPDSATQMMQQNTIHFREMEELRGRLDRIERRLDTLTPSR